MRTLLQLVQAATGEMGLSVPTYVSGNMQQDVIQLLYLANGAGRELAREFDWQALNKEFRFTVQSKVMTGTWGTASAIVSGIPSTSGIVANTWSATGVGLPNSIVIVSVDSATQVTLSDVPTTAGTSAQITFGQTKYLMPSDYDRQINRTHYDTSRRWAMMGPETAQQWQFLKSSYISTGPRVRYRLMGGMFQIWPILATPEHLGFEYVSNAWSSSSIGAAQMDFKLDSDICIYPDNLMILAIKRAYFAVKGFETSSLERDFQRELSIAKVSDTGAQTLAMAARPSSVLVGYENIPDSGYGQ